MAGNKVAAGGNGKKRKTPKKPRPKKLETMIAAGGRGKQRKKKSTG